MSSAVAGYKMTLGADAPPTCYDDVNHADCIFIVGSNTAYAHPVLFRRIEERKAQRPHMKIIFCDPRRTDTAELADLYLPILPGTDVMLFHGLLHILLWEGWTRPEYIAAHTSGFDALRAMVARMHAGAGRAEPAASPRRTCSPRPGGSRLRRPRSASIARASTSPAAAPRRTPH
jgi:anaerobic selenocysteine-containing dehydrogenase